MSPQFVSAINIRKAINVLQFVASRYVTIRSYFIVNIYIEDKKGLKVILIFHITGVYLNG